MWVQSDRNDWIKWNRVRKLFVEFDENSGFYLYIDFENGEKELLHNFREHFQTERSEEYWYKLEDIRDITAKVLSYILNFDHEDDNMVHWEDIEEHIYREQNDYINQTGRIVIITNKKGRTK